MPNVKEGSVIEYKYVIKSPYFHEVNDWYFQYAIPANNVSFEMAVPIYFDYNRYLAGYVHVDQTAPSKRWGVASNFEEVFTVYSAKNIKALKQEAYVGNVRNYLSILKHELAAVKMKNQEPKYYSTDWEAVSKKIYTHDDFGKQLGYKDYFAKDLDPLLKGATTNEQKMQVVYNFVKERMNWNENSRLFCDKGVKKAYEARVGNSSEINIMLTAMLRHAGLNANPVLVSTRSNGVALYPTIAAYNYVIAALKTDSGFMLLDATSKNALPNVLPVRTLNWVGRLIQQDGSTVEIDLMPKTSSKEVMNISVAMDKDGKISGKTRDQYFDYNAHNFRENYAGTSKESYIEKLEKYYKGIEISEYTVHNEKDLSKPVMEEYSFTHNNVSDVIGDKIYFSPMLFTVTASNPFKDDTREYPIEFVFPQQDRYMVNITIPEGYKVESLPKPVTLMMEEGIGSFKYNIVSKDNQVQLSVIYDINYATVSKDYYDTLKDFFQKMIEKQNEKIILKKA
ncbi:MAG: transglutaminase domain-containing protein [Flavobacterium sp.]|nr:MAG: transglutaminase domain-containing protein [Flavobacterium sp.]